MGETVIPVMWVLAGGEKEVPRHGSIGLHLHLALARPWAVRSGLATGSHGRCSAPTGGEAGQRRSKAARWSARAQNAVCGSMTAAAWFGNRYVNDANTTERGEYKL